MSTLYKIRKFLKTAIYSYKASGLRGLGGRIYMSFLWRTESLKQKLYSWFRAKQFRLTRNNWLAGRIIEILGNKGRIFGMVFDLDNPYIATFLKSRFLFKTYESGAARLIADYVDVSLPVIEFGGCIGVMSCLVNRRLLNPERHIVVEAQPYLIHTLKVNRDRNGAKFEVIHAALAYGAETVQFWINPQYFIGNSVKIRADGEIVSVPAITLQRVLEKMGAERVTLIVDVEGAEADLVDHEISILQQFVDTLIVELHPEDWGAGKDRIDRLKVTLNEAGFKKMGQIEGDYIYKNQRI